MIALSILATGCVKRTGSDEIKGAWKVTFALS